MKPWLNMRGGLLFWILAVAALAVSGCGGPYNASVSGVVTLDGNNLPRGTVAYHPVASGPAAYARINSDGSYVVRTGRAEGLPAGEYQVTVAANELPAEKQSKLGGPPAPGKPITPPWYRTTQSSGLNYKIEPGKNNINLELKSQPPAGWKPGRTR